MTPIDGLETLWTQTLGDPSICIALLDGPVDSTHPCFAGAHLTQVETLVTGAARQDGVASTHGTHIASVLFGQPDSLLQGVAPRCCGLILPVFAESVDGASISCSQIDLARAITQAVQQGAQIINISGGQITPSGKAHPFLADAVRLCADSNVLIVAAAGNDGCACLHVPAALPSVLVVGALDAQGLPFDFSNWGESYQPQGILAPGSNILGAAPGGSVVAKSGTSFATPIVTGVAALLLSLQQKHGEKLDPHAIREALLTSAIPCDSSVATDCRRFLRGSLNLPGAYAQIMPAEKNAAVYPDDSTNAVPRQAMPAVNIAQTSNQSSKLINRNPTTLEQAQAAQRRKFMSSLDQDTASVETEAPTCENEVHEAAYVQPQTMPESASVVTPPLSAMPRPPAPPLTNRQTGAAVRPSQVRPAQADTGALVYALGTLGYDFGTDARRDWFANSLVDLRGGHPPEDAQILLDFLTNGLRQPPAPQGFVADSLIWTLNLDATPIYAIKPAGPFAATTYDTLRALLKTQLDTEDGETYTRVAVPGILQGSIMLRSGQVVPVIVPDPRGLDQTTPEGIHPATKPTADPSSDKKVVLTHERSAEISQQLLYRLFYELRNLGLTPQERAKNAMSVYGIGGIASNEEFATYVLEGVSVEKSPVCRPGSDCWDVLVTAFDPADRLGHARLIFRQTIDVSDVIPTQMGTLRRWFAY